MRNVRMRNPVECSELTGRVSAATSAASMLPSGSGSFLFQVVVGEWQRKIGRRGRGRRRRRRGRRTTERQKEGPGEIRLRLRPSAPFYPPRHLTAPLPALTMLLAPSTAFFLPLPPPPPPPPPHLPPHRCPLVLWLQKASIQHLQRIPKNRWSKWITAPCWPGNNRGWRLRSIPHWIPKNPIISDDTPRASFRASPESINQVLSRQKVIENPQASPRISENPPERGTDAKCGMRNAECGMRNTRR